MAPPDVTAICVACARFPDVVISCVQQAPTFCNAGDVQLRHPTTRRMRLSRHDFLRLLPVREGDRRPENLQSMLREEYGCQQLLQPAFVVGGV